MFIRNELIKKINETYFRNYQSSDLKQLSKNPTDEEIREFMDIMSNMEHIQGYNLSEGENSLYSLVMDLSNHKHPEWSCLSEIGHDLNQKKCKAIKRVQKHTMLQKNHQAKGLADVYWFVHCSSRIGKIF